MPLTSEWPKWVFALVGTLVHPTIAFFLACGWSFRNYVEYFSPLELGAFAAVVLLAYQLLDYAQWGLLMYGVTAILLVISGVARVIRHPRFRTMFHGADPSQHPVALVDRVVEWWGRKVGMNKLVGLQLLLGMINISVLIVHVYDLAPPEPTSR